MDRVRWLYDEIIRTAAFVAFSAMLGAALAGTVARYLPFLPSISWGEEVTRYAGIWSVFLVAGLGLRHGAHLGVDMLTVRLPAPVRRVLYLSVYTLVLAFAGLLLIYGIQLAAENMDQVSPALEWPMGVVYLCIPVGGALMIVETLGLLYRAARGLPPPRPPLEEAGE